MQKPFQSPSNMSLKATVVGAGFSGLTTAYFLHKNGYAVKVIEKNSQVAGLLQSPMTKYGVIDHAANGLINSKALIDLCSEIGVELLYPGPNAKKKYLLYKGKMTRWPFGIFETLKVIAKIFKFKRNKLKFQPNKGESFKLWVERVFSSKLLNRLIEPAFQGVYASFSKNLSATLVTKNLFKDSNSSKGSGVKRQTVCFNGGMQEFCKSLAAYLTSNGVNIVLNTEVSKLDPSELNILTCSANMAGHILGDINAELARDLAKVKSISIAKVACFIKKEDHNPEGFGCLFPKSEGFNSLGVLFDSAIFPSRYKGHSLQTWILGDELLKTCKNDEQIITKVKEDALKLWDKELKFDHIDVKLWKDTLPLYNNDLEQFIEKYNLEKEVTKNVYLFGNYTGNLGLSQLLEKSKELATRINYEQTK